MHTVVSGPFRLKFVVISVSLSTFFEYHYRDTAGTVGQALIKAGQFHVLLGSRRGRVLHGSNWDPTMFRPGWRVVNSVYVVKDEAKCLKCHVAMIVTAQGEFHCLTCKTYHRDYDTFSQASARLVPAVFPIGENGQSQKVPVNSAQASRSADRSQSADPTPSKKPTATSRRPSNG